MFYVAYGTAKNLIEVYVHSSYFSLQVELKLQRVAGCDVTAQLSVESPSKVHILHAHAL
jgi:hypothetical protein